MEHPIPLVRSTLGQQEIYAAKSVLDSGNLTMGRRCYEFEQQFASYVGCKHAVMVNSGSSANLLALFALANPLLEATEGRSRVMPGDEVIVPALTWSTTIWPVIQIGAKPVFVDCDPNTLQMRPEEIEAALSDKTKAIVAVHVLGGAGDSTGLGNIARKHRLWFVEDTCESLGVLWDNKIVGTFGDFGTYSFYFSHHITTIEGGMIVTNSDSNADLLRSLRAHGWVRDMNARSKNEYAERYPDVDPRYMFVTTGFNVRPTEINGVLGIHQLKRLNGFNQDRRDIARQFDAELSSLQRAGHLSLIRHSERSIPAPFGYTVVCEESKTRSALRDWLESVGIETRPVICGNMARQPALALFDHRTSGLLSGCDRIMDCGLYWGLHPGMTNDEVQKVIGAVKEFFK